MVGWYHWLYGPEFEQALGVGDGQGSLAAAVQGITNSWTWLSEWTELNECPQPQGWPPPVLFRTCRSNSPCAFPQPQGKHQVLLSLLQILWMPQDLWGKNYSKIRKPCLMFFLSLPLVFCSLVWLIYVFFNIDNVTEEVARIHRRTVQKRSSWPR